MLRIATATARNCVKVAPRATSVVASKRFAHAVESDEAFDARWIAYFKRDNIDDWELRKGLNDLYGYDCVPDPKIVNSALHAARRLDNYPLTVRIFEMIKAKAGGDHEIYNYVVAQCKPTLEELGLNTPEELGLA